jgi:predicted ATP-dependent endonuclease of OLD family
MFISNVKIENYRALEKIDVPLSKFSVIIGENDVGKTSILHAINTFFESKKISSKDDFYQKEENRVIKIALKFSELPDDDELISIRNPDNTVTIQKTIHLWTST